MTKTFSVDLRRLDDPRLTAEHYALLQALYLETTEWCAQSQRDPSPEDIRICFASQQSIWRAVFNGEDGEFVGVIGLERINWIDRVGEPTISILPDYRRKGWSKAIAETFREFLIAKFGIRRLQVAILEGAPSRGLLTRLGFVQEGTFRALRWKGGSYIDGLMYAWVKE